MARWRAHGAGARAAAAGRRACGARALTRLHGHAPSQGQRCPHREVPQGEVPHEEVCHGEVCLGEACQGEVCLLEGPGGLGRGHAGGARLGGILACGRACGQPPLDGPTCSLLTTHYSPRTPHRLPPTTHPALLTTGTHAPPGTAHPTSCSPTTRAARGAWRRPPGARWTRRRWRSCPTARSVVTLTVTVPLTLT